MCRRGLGRLLAASGTKREEAGRRHPGLLDRRFRALLEVTQQPAGGDAGVATRILPRDQERQLERLAEADPADLLRRRLGDDQVLVLERSTKDGAGMPLRGRCSSSRGRDGFASLERERQSA